MVDINTYFTLAPNWEKPVSISREWKTGVLASETGDEQRSALWAVPRLSQEYTALNLRAAESNYLKRKFWKHLAENWGIPIWTDRLRLAAPAAAGTRVLSVSSLDNMEYKAGGRVILMDPANPDSYEAHAIASVGTGLITINTNLVYTWPAGSRIAPVMICRISPRQRLKMRTDAYSEISIQAQEIKGSDAAKVETAGSWPVYESKYVFSIRPTWARSPELQFLGDTRILEGLSRSVAWSNLAETLLGPRFDFQFSNRAAIRDLVTFFDVHRGRWKGFWIPTWSADLRLAGAVSAGSATIPIKDVKYSDYWAASEQQGRYLVFRLPGGPVYRKVVGWPSATSLTLDSALGVDLSADAARGVPVHFLLPVRFDSDELKLTFETDSVAKTTISFRADIDTPSEWDD